MRKNTGYVCLISLLMLFGCQDKSNKKNQEKISDKIFYKDFFGETYLAQGVFLRDSTTKIETKQWLYASLDSSTAFYGDFVNGKPTGSWNFTLGDGFLMSSQWETYSNQITPCSFSLPFKYEETQASPNLFKLSTLNDSLGKVTVIVQISKNVEKEENLKDFGKHADAALYGEGFVLAKDKIQHEIRKNDNRYFFTEYFLKDSLQRDAKVYFLYGNTVSKKYFVQFTFFHQGPKEDLVKLIYSVISTTLYIDNERFFDPYNINQ